MLSANILVVEKETDILQTIGHMLEDMDYQYKLVASAEEALEIFDKRAFDAVLSAADLTAADGVEMVCRMRASEPALGVIMALSHSGEDAVGRCLEYGINHFLIKPFTPGQLGAKIADALAERRQYLERNQLVGNLMREHYMLQERVVSQSEKLTHTESYLQNLLDASPFGILSTDMENHIVTYNETCRSMYGFKEAEVQGRDVATLLQQLDQSPEPNRTLHARRDGSPFPVLVHHREIRDITGQRVGHLYMIEDLSEREELEGHLLHAQKLSLLGDLAPRLAHEIKTPLQLITGYSELARQWLDDGDSEQVDMALHHIKPAIDQILNIVRQMSNLGKPAENRNELVYLHLELEKLIDELQPLSLFNIHEVDCDFAADLPPLQGDPDQLEHLFRNLIINALQAMENQPERKLELSLALSDDGRRIEAVVGDTGTGIAPENIDKIYQPFFTTKTENKGTGLGMVVIKTIADHHRASVRVESQEGKGTRFRLSFPRAISEEGERTR